MWKSFNNKTVETSELCSLSQLSTPNGLLENLPSSFIIPFIPLTQSQQTNLFIFSLSQVLSSQGMPTNQQQSTANKITPVMITGMFLFFPLPAGVLLYMVVANIFQAFQTFLLNKEALPENLQKILDQQLLAKNEVITTSASTISDKRLPFEPNSKK